MSVTFAVLLLVLTVAAYFIGYKHGQTNERERVRPEGRRDPVDVMMDDVPAFELESELPERDPPN